MRRLLLISSSKTYGTGFLEHCRDAIAQHLAGVETVLFIPYALADHDGYASAAARGFEPIGLELNSIHTAPDPVDAVERAQAIFVGGGNTFRLLKTLYELDLIPVIRQRVWDGMPYMGSSAGTNMACPTIKTTNDMPILEPPSFEALGVVPFQINPHFIDADPTSKHQGETRETRLAEYLEENDVPVIGIREGSWLVVQGETGLVGGDGGAMLFRRGETVRPLEPGSKIDFLLSATTPVDHG